MTLHANICENCGGEGFVIEFRRFAGEYQAGEPIEVECHECGGEGSWADEPEVCRVCATVLIDGECAICDQHIIAAREQLVVVEHLGPGRIAA